MNFDAREYICPNFRFIFSFLVWLVWCPFINVSAFLSKQMKEKLNICNVSSPPFS